MKRVRGYLTQDGTFFELEVDANLYETELKLRDRAAFAKIDPDRLLDAIRILNEPMWTYINALKNKQANSPDTIDSDKPQFGDTAQETPSVLELAPVSDEHVPDMGGDPQPEAVRLKRKGTRS